VAPNDNGKETDLQTPTNLPVVAAALLDKPSLATGRSAPAKLVASLSAGGAAPISSTALLDLGSEPTEASVQGGKLVQGTTTIGKGSSVVVLSGDQPIDGVVTVVSQSEVSIRARDGTRMRLSLESIKTGQAKLSLRV